MAMVFLSTPSARRATCCLDAKDQVHDEFLSTPSARRATVFHDAGDDGLRDFYPRPPRGGRHGDGPHPCRSCAISIHALREEGDHAFFEFPSSNKAFLSTPSARRATNHFLCVLRIGNISIHALREEGDITHCTKNCELKNFYPRPPRGGRPVPLAGWSSMCKISIHALREEGDYNLYFHNGKVYTFLSTPSARRATIAGSCLTVPQVISIHALREEGDIHDFVSFCIPANISIHALREEGDLPAIPTKSILSIFLSTPSAGRATADFQVIRSGQFQFLSTPSAGRATVMQLEWCRLLQFLSTPSAGRATAWARTEGFSMTISIHALRGEGDDVGSLMTAVVGEFLSTPSAGRATRARQRQKNWLQNFYPRPPRGGRPVAGLLLRRFPQISIHALRGEGDADA